MANSAHFSKLVLLFSASAVTLLFVVGTMELKGEGMGAKVSKVPIGKSVSPTTSRVAPKGSERPQQSQVSTESVAPAPTPSTSPGWGTEPTYAKTYCKCECRYHDFWQSVTYDLCPIERASGEACPRSRWYYIEASVETDCDDLLSNSGPVAGITGEAATLCRGYDANGIHREGARLYACQSTVVKQ